MGSQIVQQSVVLGVEVTKAKTVSQLAAGLPAGR